MARTKPFTPEQIRSLEANVYTHHVTPNRIVFTVAFKEFFAAKAAIPGMTTQKILKAAGYDLNLFTRSNMDSIRKSILREAASGDGFKAPRGLSGTERISQFAEKDLTRQRTKTSIKEMQERIVRLEYQIEFLKKISRIRSGSGKE